MLFKVDVARTLERYRSEPISSGTMRYLTRSEDATLAASKIAAEASKVKQMDAFPILADEAAALMGQSPTSPLGSAAQAPQPKSFLLSGQLEVPGIVALPPMDLTFRVDPPEGPAQPTMNFHLDAQWRNGAEVNFLHEPGFQDGHQATILKAFEAGIKAPTPARPILQFVLFAKDPAWMPKLGE
jgi:hypothetical protein